jgi:acyl homoserine lactone synthase
MDHYIATYALRAMSPMDSEGMHRLRYEIFSQKLGWEVNVQNGLERDQFDDVSEVEYMLAKSPEGSVEACWRLLPTLGPNMLRDTFPQLLHGQSAPCGADCWELSRFCVATDRAGTSNATVGPVSMALMAESAAFAKARGIVRYVTVTTPVMERMLKHAGLHISRIGPPIRIGVASAVACIIELDEITLRAVGYIS